ncbi:hypothetical protein SY88_23725 [Clostridiales bacterium PH28_bin88]|nr:hypothetical protein SY88_23725 [Clostridiales bacterium PH28_bin88]
MAKKINRGKPLEELVKGSLDYTMAMIREAFRKQFPMSESGPYIWIEEIFADHLIAHGEGQKVDEYYSVGYQRQDGEYVFAPQNEWRVVELTYQPAGIEESSSQGKRKEKRFVESVGTVELLEAVDGQPRKIKAIGITADVVNGNGRLYPAAVLEAAVQDLQNHLHESAGQGRLMLLGEAEHPSNKSGRPNLLETIVKWDAISFDGHQTVLDGHILETSKGRDILALMEGGVMPGISQRAYGQSKIVKQNGQQVEEVTKLRITGYDLVIEPSDPNAAVILFESKSDMEETMDPEEILKIIREHPELFRGLIAEDVKKLSDEQAQLLESKIRQSLGIDESADLAKALTEAVDAKKTLDAQSAQKAVDEAVAEQTKELPYGKLNESFVQAVRDAKPATPEAVKSLVETKRKEYDKIVSDAKLAGMGFHPQGGVIEIPGNQPGHIRGSLELLEHMERRGMYSKPADDLVNARFTREVLERFDEVFKRQLAEEGRAFEEAETTADLNLPYSVSRAIIAAATPVLVATSVFDFATIDTSPTRLYFEQYTGETGSTGTVVDEDATAALNGYVSLANKRLIPGTVVITNSAGTVTYVEGSDYVVDYANGRFMALATITNGQALKVDYQYDAIRKGEMAAIERGKVQLSFKTIEAIADRLATQISREAIVFSRSQIGFDAVARTLAALTREIAHKIDNGIFYLALASVLQVSNNSGGTWNRSSDTLQALIEKVGVAKVKVANRYYQPNAVVLSLTNSDKVANWDGFTAAGSRPDATLNANGYVGRVKGLNVFETTEFTDDYILVVNRELVMHRVYIPMLLRGPFPSYSDGKLVAADQYYAEEFNLSDSPIVEKGSYVKLVD